MTMIGKRRRTPNFDPPSDARLATITRVGPRPGTAIYATEWRVTLADEATLRRVRVAPSGHVRKALPERDPRGCGQRCLKEHLAENKVALPGGTRVAPQEACGQHHLDRCAEAGASYRSCTASPQRRRGVTVPSLIETICEL